MNITKLEGHNKLVRDIVNTDVPSQRVSLYPLSNTLENFNKVTEHGVNWAGCGTVTVEEAEKYVELLQVAIEEAKKINAKVTQENK